MLKELFTIYWKCTRPQQQYFWTFVCSVSIGTVCYNVMMPYYFSTIIDAISQPSIQEQSHRVWQDVTTMGVCLLIAFLGWRIGEFCLVKVEAKTMETIENHLFQKLLTHSHEFFSNTFTGSLVTKFNRFVRSYMVFLDNFMFNFLPVVITLTFVVGTLFIMLPQVAWAMIGFSILYIIVLLVIIRWKWHADTISAAANSKVTGTVTDVWNNMSTVKSFASEEFEFDTFRKKNNDRFRKRETKWMRGIALSAAQSFMRECMLISIVIAGIISVFNGTMTIGNVVLLFTYSRNLFEQLWKLSRVIRDSYTAYADSLEMLDIMLINNDIQDPQHPLSIDTEKAGCVSFENVTFSYEKTAAPLIENFTLHIPSGQKIGFVGESGSGKTTLTKLLQRLYDVDHGSISIGGRDIRSVTKQALRSTISHVAQEPALFHRTLRENITYGNPNASDKAIISAAEHAHVHEFSMKLPQKYETKVGERGIKLSGGQRQRVAIARALMEETSIIVLDEATSSLDSHSEKKIQRALDSIIKNDRTTIVIAHRLPTIMQLDRVIVMENGNIIQDGHPKELIKQKGKFQQLWNNQF